MARQLELEKASLLERKRREQDERRRKQEELDQILLENRRKVRAAPSHPLCQRAVALDVCYAESGVSVWMRPSVALSGLTSFRCERCFLQVEEAQMRAEQDRLKRQGGQ